MTKLELKIQRYQCYFNGRYIFSVCDQLFFIVKDTLIQLSGANPSKPLAAWLIVAKNLIQEDILKKTVVKRLQIRYCTLWF